VNVLAVAGGGQRAWGTRYITEGREHEWSSFARLDSRGGRPHTTQIRIGITM
jgi:hypothetical protein